MKGHNYGFCRKCGKEHIHPRGTLGKISWNKGLTKETDERVAKSAKNLGQTLRKQFQEGREQWNKGKTKKTHPQLARSQESNMKVRRALLEFNSKLSKEERSLKYGSFGDSNPAKREDVKEKLRVPNPKKGHWGDKNPSRRPEVKEKIRKKAKARYSDPAWRKNFLISIRNNLFSVESFKHIKLKQEAKEHLESLGYITKVEHPVSVGNKSYIVDVFGFGERTIAVECGGCTKNKLSDLRSISNTVIHIPYGSGVSEVIGKCLGAS